MKAHVTFDLLGARAMHFAAALVLSYMACAAPAMQDDKGQTSAATAQEDGGDLRAELEAELEELGATLKAAVFSGSLTGEEARRIFKVMATSIKMEWVSFP